VRASRGNTASILASIDHIEIGMPSRSRERSRENAIPGQYVFGVRDGPVLDGPYPGFSGPRWNETCLDSTQPPPYTTDQTFYLVRKMAGGAKLNGFYPLFLGYGNTYSNYSVTNRTGYQYCPAPSGQIDPTYWVTKALANMNPSRPTVDLPLFLFEFKDFPRMLRDLGRILKRDLNPATVPNGYLAYQFGWAPLVSDVMKLLNLQQSIEERKRYLKRLERGARVKRTLFSGELSRTREIDGYTLAGVTADVDITEHLKVWFSANAKLKISLESADLNNDSTIRKILLGAQPSGSTLWNMVPWSWLIDYFINVGDTIEAQRGWLPFSVTRMCVMYHSIKQSNLSRLRVDDGLSFTDSGMITESKQRSVHANPTPALAYDPFLSGSQVGILTSLVMARVLGGTKLSDVMNPWVGGSSGGN
jgi:hypothetical protein